MRIIIALFFLFNILSLKAQTNILSTNPLAEQILLGNYDAADYQASTVLNHPDDIVQGIHSEISTDSLKAYLIKLSEFRTRNTGSDTTSATEGMGAARRWVYQKFQEFSAVQEQRLIPSYLQFDQVICGMGQHRNIFAVLPGLDTDNPSTIIIEGHIDSRCDVLCDVDCLAEGSEDNASGTALVMELARVMSKYSFNRTIVFMATIGEEQGLLGADAFATYAIDKGINIKAVLNNDVVGGIICGKTSSPPSCPGFNEVDSTQVRLFSSGSQNSPHKSLARFIKLQYQEELLPLVSVPMMITIMSAEDRTGRGGDHIPFREKGFPAMRFTSANEHGDASVGPDYTDRQHTSDDILGVDTDGDNIIDSFFVDFNYLCRNATINGVAAGLLGIGPKTPGFNAYEENGIIYVAVEDPENYNHYRLGIRSGANDFDTLLTFTNVDTLRYIPDNFGLYHISITAVDSNGIESCFTGEEFFIVNTVGVAELPQEEASKAIELFQNRPNPFDEATFITFLVREMPAYGQAYLRIADMSGREVRRIDIQLQSGMNEILYEHGYNTVGTFIYSLVVDGEVIASKPMVFAN